MYSLVSGVYSAYLAPPQLNLLIVGAQGAGKTTLLERLKVTKFEKTKKIELSPAATLPVNILKGEIPPPAPPSTATPSSTRSSITSQPRRLSSWICPAPPKYAFAVDDDDDESDGDNNKNGEITGATPTTLLHRESTTGSMVSVELGSPVQESKRLVSSSSPASSPSTTTTTPTTVDATPASTSSTTAAAAAPATSATSTPATTDTNTPAALAALAAVVPPQQPEGDYDLKPGAKMLPLVKIRPTIGMNLGKQVPICGCQCNVWDLGGKLQHLWKRYYDDCDAVLFVWKLTLPADDKPGQDNGPTDNASDEDDDSDAPPVISYEQQVELLDQVRESIPDDVPFVVMCHLFNDNRNSHVPLAAFCNQRYQTNPHLMPHYHNPNTSLFFFNAATGNGVKSAMEWLIPLARQLQHQRTRGPPRHSVTTGDDDNGGVGSSSVGDNDFVVKDHGAASI